MQIQTSDWLTFTPLNNLFSCERGTGESTLSRKDQSKRKSLQSRSSDSVFAPDQVFRHLGTRVLLLIPKALQNQEMLALDTFSTILQASSDSQVSVQSHL